MRDLRRAWRTLARRPIFALSCVILLSAGVGANVGLFSAANALFLRPRSGIADQSTLVWLTSTDRREPGRLDDVSYPEFVAYRDDSAAFSRTAASTRIVVDVQAGALSDELFGELVSPDYFGTLGVRPQLGRYFDRRDADDRRAAPVAVISDRLFRRLGGDAAAIGSTVRVNDALFTIIGVTPPGFDGPEAIGPDDVWLPVALGNAVSPAGYEQTEMRIVRHFRAVARLRPGVTIAQATAALRVTAATVARDYPRTNVGMSAEAVAMRGGVHPTMYQWMGREFARVAALMLFLLLLTCGNVAGLFYSRLQSRRHELAIQRATGASRWDVVRAVMVEAMLLALGGAVGGILVAKLVATMFVPISRASADALLDTSVGLLALGLAVVIALLAGLLFGGLPALAFTRHDVNAELRGTVPRSRTRRWGTTEIVVAAQIAGAFALTVAAALTVRSTAHVDAGSRPMAVARQLLVFTYHPSRQEVASDQLAAYYLAERDSVARVPGVRSAAVAAVAPYSAAIFRQELRPRAEAGDTYSLININAVGRGYFRTTHVRVLAGRDFTDTDLPGAPRVAVVNLAAARRWWGTRSPVGEVLTGGTSTSEAVVVGVVDSSTELGVDRNSEPTVYFPIQQRPPLPGGALVIADVGTDTARTRRAIVSRLTARAHPPRNLGVASMATIAEEHTAGARRMRALLGAAGAFAFLLTAVGVFACVAFGVQQRMREMGLRAALGARPTTLARLVYGGAGRMLVAGVLGGEVVAAAMTGVVQHVLVGVTRWDPAAHIVALLLTGVVALLATAAPAIRAARVAPSEVLRDVV